MLSKRFETRRLHVMSPAAKPVMALYTYHKRFWSAFTGNQNHTSTDTNTSKRADLLLVTLKWDLAIVCFTTFGVTVVIFHFNSRLCSIGSSSTIKAWHMLEFTQLNKEELGFKNNEWFDYRTWGCNTASWYDVSCKYAVGQFQLAFYLKHSHS